MTIASRGEDEGRRVGHRVKLLLGKYIREKWSTKNSV